MVRTSVIGFLCGLSLCSAASAENITSDSHFYGQSPPVYPSQGTGSASWATAYRKARDFVANLSPDEKVNLTAGVKLGNGCMGNIPPIPRVGFPGLCASDAENGLRSTDYVNGWSSGIHVGASWNKELARQRGMHMGQEFRQKGVQILLGPVVGPIGRVATGGRNWEGFSSDPYHTGALGAETIIGTQSRGVSVSTKHYIGNEQELYRNPQTGDQGEHLESVSSNIDDATMHELYLWPFQDAVRAGSASVMCSYERINNSYGCQNSKTLNGILKEELGFQGYVMTDWFAQHGGIAAANAGLDMVMPTSTLWGSNLTDAIANGTMDASRLDDMATRIIASWYQVDQDMSFPPTGVGMPHDVNADHQRIIATYPAERETLLQSAIEGHVLVKNTKRALPLQSPRLLSVFGYDAKGPQSLEFNTKILDANQSLTSEYATLPAIQKNHTLWVGGGSGSNSPAYVDAPLDALQRQSREDSSSLLWNFDSQDPVVNPTSDACLVFINSYSSETFDRPGLTDEYSDTLVHNVASKCNNTMVIIHNAGIRLVDAWVDHENITAVIFAHLPGQDTGQAIVDLLYGRANPSGRLPYTVARQAEDYGSLLHHSTRKGKHWLFPQSDFTEGLLTDYRAFDAHDITPRYEFGYGLSYTSFAYTNLVIDRPRATTAPYPPSAPTEQGGNPHLWDEIATVSVSVTNAGSMDGDEVVQLYVGIPNRPIRQLRGFEKVRTNAGETAQVGFRLTRRDLSVWDVVAQRWHLQKGEYQVYVGRSSRDLPLKGVVTVACLV